jgi:hypothetical protein
MLSGRGDINDVAFNDTASDIKAGGVTGDLVFTAGMDLDDNIVLSANNTTGLSLVFRYIYRRWASI